MNAHLEMKVRLQGDRTDLMSTLLSLLRHLRSWAGAALVAQAVKSLLQCRRPGFSPWVGKIPWRREWLPTPVFLSGEFHGQRSLVGYSPCGHKESDTTEHLAHHTDTAQYQGKKPVLLEIS